MRTTRKRKDSISLKQSLSSDTMCKKKCCKHRTKINKTIQSQSRLDLIIDNPFDTNQKDIVLMNDIPIPKGLKNSKQSSKEDDSLLRPIVWIDIHKGPSASKLFATDVVTLCDSGADDTMIKRRCLPDGTTLIKSPEESSRKAKFLELKIQFI